MSYQDDFNRRIFLSNSMRWGAAAVLSSASFASAENSDSQEDKEQSAWKIGIYTRPWDKFDYRVALDSMVEAGFKYVGLMNAKPPAGEEWHFIITRFTTSEEALEVAQEVKKRGLKILSIYGHEIPVQESLQAGIEGLKRIIDNCAICSADNLLMGGVTDEKIHSAYYKAIAECCDYAMEKGIGISIKPHGGLNATGLQCRRIVEMVNHKNFGIWYDPGNIYYYSDGKRSPVLDAADVDGLVMGMSVKDYLHPKNVLVTPGDGKVDFPAVMWRLKKGGFKAGPLVIECLKPGNLKEITAKARKARLFLEELTESLKQM
jgi:sugar phosphate isomerase/epimerase